MENENRVRIQSDAIIKFISIGAKRKREEEVLNDEMYLNNKE